MTFFCGLTNIGENFVKQHCLSCKKKRNKQLQLDDLNLIDNDGQNDFSEFAITSMNSISSIKDRDREKSLKSTEDSEQDQEQDIKYFSNENFRTT